MSGQNLNVIEIAEALRPNLAGLLIQQIAPLNEPCQSSHLVQS